MCVGCTECGNLVAVDLGNDVRHLQQKSATMIAELGFIAYAVSYLKS